MICLRSHFPALAATLLFGALSCSTSNPAGVQIVSVSVSLASPTLTVGQTATAVAVVHDASGNVVEGQAISWASSNQTVASVGDAAQVTALAAGTTQITATSGGASGSTTLTVAALPPAPVSSVAVTLNSAALIVGQTTQATATTRDASNGVLTGRVIAWSSDNTAVATVSGTGLVTAVAAGTAHLVATSEGKSGSATLTVSAAPVAPVASVSVALASGTLTMGQTTQATATTRDASNGVLTGRAIAWSSDNTAVATVSGTGLVTAVAAGTAHLVATSEGKSGSATLAVTAATAAAECAAPKPGWIWCDDFEADRLSSYFEYSNSGGKFARATGTGVGGSVGMRTTYTTGQSAAGSLALAFGRTPSAYFRPADAGTANFREVYWRFYVRREAGWVGNGPMKLTRATILAKADWSQAMIAHGWTSESDDRYLMIDPARGTDASGNVTTVGYNDFAHLQWIGGVQSAAPEEDQAHVGQWACYEYHVKLNDAGQSNGLFEFRVNGQMSAQKTGMDWVGAYSAYGINAVLLENFVNTGAPAANVRTLDNFVVSTQPIGC